MLLAIQEAAAQAGTSIDTGGWIFMVVSVGFVTVLMIWCFAKVLSLPPEEEKREEETLEHFHTA
jgi:hypothetical protein